MPEPGQCGSMIDGSVDQGLDDHGAYGGTIKSRIDFNKDLCFVNCSFLCLIPGWNCKNHINDLSPMSSLYASKSTPHLDLLSSKFNGRIS
jgi:hypothetical protein